MGKINLTMQISMDGIISNEDQWMTLSEEFFEDYYAYYNTVETIIIGGHSYSSMAQHWQNAEKYSNNDLERGIAKRMNDIPKVVISSSILDLEWKNSQQILVKDDESLANDIKKLRIKGGKISVVSGVKTWQLIIRNDLFDDLWLLVHPVIVSQGERLFAHANKQFSMDLSSSKTYKNGVLGLQYQK
jgi:dihydrofolate reductase